MKIALQKDIVERVKRQATIWEKTLAKHKFDIKKTFCLEYASLIKPKCSKTDNPTKNVQNDLDLSAKRIPR